MNYPTYFQPGYPSQQVQPYPPRPDMQGYPQQMAQQPMQNAQMQQQSPQGLSPASRPVTNRDEANAVSADFSGALMVFPDINNSRVYIKRWNIQTGAAEFMEFAPVVQTPPQQEQPQRVAEEFASAQDFRALCDLVDDLKSEIDRMKKPVGRTGDKG